MTNKIAEFYIRRKMRLDARGISTYFDTVDTIHEDIGTEGSGNWGHIGRPTKVGGSRKGGGKGFRLYIRPGVVGNPRVYTSRAKIRTKVKKTLRDARKEYEDAKKEMEKINDPRARNHKNQLDAAKTRFLTARAKFKAAVEMRKGINMRVKTADPRKKGDYRYQYVNPDASSGVYETIFNQNLGMFVPVDPDYKPSKGEIILQKAIDENEKRKARERLLERASKRSGGNWKVSNEETGTAGDRYYRKLAGSSSGEDYIPDKFDYQVVMKPVKNKKGKLIGYQQTRERVYTQRYSMSASGNPAYNLYASMARLENNAGRAGGTYGYGRRVESREKYVVQSGKNKGKEVWMTTTLYTDVPGGMPKEHKGTYGSQGERRYRSEIEGKFGTGGYADGTVNGSDAVLASIFDRTEDIEAYQNAGLAKDCLVDERSAEDIIKDYQDKITKEELKKEEKRRAREAKKPKKLSYAEMAKQEIEEAMSRTNPHRGDVNIIHLGKMMVNGIVTPPCSVRYNPATKMFQECDPKSGMFRAVNPEDIEQDTTDMIDERIGKRKHHQELTEAEVAQKKKEYKGGVDERFTKGLRTSESKTILISPERMEAELELRFKKQASKIRQAKKELGEGREESEYKKHKASINRGGFGSVSNLPKKEGKMLSADELLTISKYTGGDKEGRLLDSHAMYLRNKSFSAYAYGELSGGKRGKPLRLNMESGFNASKNRKGGRTIKHREVWKNGVKVREAYEETKKGGTLHHGVVTNDGDIGGITCAYMTEEFIDNDGEDTGSRIFISKPSGKKVDVELDGETEKRKISYGFSAYRVGNQILFQLVRAFSVKGENGNDELRVQNCPVDHYETIGEGEDAIDIEMVKIGNKSYPQSGLTERDINEIFGGASRNRKEAGLGRAGITIDAKNIEELNYAASFLKNSPAKRKVSATSKKSESESA